MASGLAKYTLPTTSKLSPLVVRVLGLNPGPFTLGGTNTYVVGNGTERALVDTGEGKDGYLEALSQALVDEGVERISPILLTHHHHDHVGGLAQLAAANSSLFDLSRVYKLPHADDSSWTPEGVAVHPLADGDEFAVDGATLRVVATPGHTPDSISLVLDEEGAVLTGDTVLGSGSTTVFTDLSGYMVSLRRLMALLPDESPARLYPAHGQVVDDGRALIADYIHHREEREAQILQAVQTAGETGVTTADIVASLYAGYPAKVLGAAARGVDLHLTKLADDGLVAWSPGGLAVSLKWLVVVVVAVVAVGRVTGARCVFGPPAEARSLEADRFRGNAFFFFQSGTLTEVTVEFAGPVRIVVIEREATASDGGSLAATTVWDAEAVAVVTDVSGVYAVALEVEVEAGKIYTIGAAWRGHRAYTVHAFAGTRFPACASWEHGVGQNNVAVGGKLNDLAPAATNVYAIGWTLEPASGSPLAAGPCPTFFDHVACSNSSCGGTAGCSCSPSRGSLNPYDCSPIGVGDLQCAYHPSVLDLAALTGIIYTNTPGSTYVNSVRCSWRLTASSAASQTTITFHAVETEAGADVFEVYSGDARYGVYSGTSIANFEITLCSPVRLQFIADEIRSRRGVAVSWAITPAPSPCVETGPRSTPFGEAPPATSGGSGADAANGRGAVSSTSSSSTQHVPVAITVSVLIVVIATACVVFYAVWRRSHRPARPDVAPREQARLSAWRRRASRPPAYASPSASGESDASEALAQESEIDLTSATSGTESDPPPYDVVARWRRSDSV
ncbi:uncharacterized protein AMSG_12320 [Thecamonas trahens ATCC 50062]|uniref:CUB domain-containing protein n=1 Tax=Thecamonas trahens ATCC 50062 TaxID=461836 RepID=A0A0L0DQ31_THETB|nr:hypothetical protein AMSG_12320 [Thecamonas trahens ATCC 50062]KNC54375.1 hypothetical protein AMSG_12320 [Thecamonas trahens ATCC 50062]|eukprot:XP_013753737.1 hypothetical protein AMSG_12320 [Thecamonas trahens ATCC 50062]